MSEFIQGELYNFLQGFRTIDGAALNHNFELLNLKFVNFTTLTGQVQRSAIDLFPIFPPTSWADFVSQYVGDPTGADGSYQIVFVTAFAPPNGLFWNLLDTYFQNSCGFDLSESLALLNVIWANADTLPL